MTRADKRLMCVLLFNAMSSIGGGLALITGVIPEQRSWIEHTTFNSLYAPGVILMAIVGGSAALASLALAKHSVGIELVSLASGLIMVVWIIGEIASIRGFHFLQVIYLLTGVAVIWLTPSERPTRAAGSVSPLRP